MFIGLGIHEVVQVAVVVAEYSIFLRSTNAVGELGGGVEADVSVTAPVMTFFIFVRTNAAPLPGLTCWNSTTCITLPSISKVTPFLKFACRNHCIFPPKLPPLTGGCIECTKLAHIVYRKNYIFSRGNLLFLQNYQIFRASGNVLAAVFRDNGHVLNADAEFSGQIDAGLGGARRRLRAAARCCLRWGWGSRGSPDQGCGRSRGRSIRRNRRRQ